MVKHCTKCKKPFEGETKRCGPCRKKERGYAKKRRGTDKRKATQSRAEKKYKGSALGKATQKRSDDRRQSTPHRAMQSRLLALAHHILGKKQQKESRTFVELTAFDSAEELRERMEEQLLTKVGEGVTMKDYGTKWELDHKIPQRAYDLADEVDRKRCWCPSNVQPLSPPANREKGIKIIDELCLEVGIDNWPKKWNGVLRTEEQKQAFYAECRPARAGAAAAAGSSSNNDDEDDEDE